MKNLPPRPEDFAPVKAWSEPVVLPTYEPFPADKNPMFLEKRVYQGSSGRVYPLPFTDRIATEPRDREWKAIHVENEFLRVMILPEIGGRIHVGFDKTNGYDFFYRQNVIKPALVGLAGSWISGGMELNWPQHHRPATFMPLQSHIEQHEDGSVTVWCGDHDPMNRLKGMHGVCLHPGKAFIELKVRLYNRTPLVQTFLWWANVAARVHEQYQSFFPPDVHYVADHARRAMSRYPLCEGLYYGVDYRRRAAEGVPPGEAPGHFLPPGTYSPNDLRWYANIPVPTSYMAMGSEEDFFGGYDHKKQAGVIHVANRHIAPGKKQWTWGNHEFGYAWDRNLTDADGPYIELMAGVYTDNQPDFSWLQPYEARTWSQFWYPIQQIGPAKQANARAALNLERTDGLGWVGVCVTETFPNATVRMACNGVPVFEQRINLSPGHPFLHEFAGEGQLSAQVLAEDGVELIQYTLRDEPQAGVVPDPATEPPAPERIETIDELYITGLHLEQYRHATRHPEPYWEEALRRDPLENRCNTALGILKLRRGEWTLAEDRLRRAVERQTRRNANPPDGEAYYYLGLTLQRQGRLEEAYGAYYKAVWNYAWQAAGYFQLALIDSVRGKYQSALDHLDLSLRVNTGNLKARNLKASLLRLTGRATDAQHWLRETVAMDALDIWARYELSWQHAKSKAELQRYLPLDAQLHLDLALDYADAGFFAEAAEVLQRLLPDGGPVYPMVLYVLGDLADSMGQPEQAREYRERAASATSDYCFPSRIEEMQSLEAALRANPADAKAHYYLGNLFYDKRRYLDAIAAWEESVRHDPSFSIAWRNLGIARFNIQSDPAGALEAYRRAFACNPGDARLLYELDQVRKRTGAVAGERIAFLDGLMPLVEMRDDLMVEFITLCNQVGRHDQALQLLLSRHFSPWEGGEGLVSGQYVWTHFLLGRQLLQSGRAIAALEHFEAARHYPENLGEAKHLLSPETHLDFYTGLAFQQSGRPAEAEKWWARAGSSPAPHSWFTYYQARALQALGRADSASAVLRDLRSAALGRMREEVKVDYFATSLPNFLLFDDDLAKRNQIDRLFLIALADLGEGEPDIAASQLKKILAMDKNHLAAEQELRELEQRNAVFG